eukprot:568593-Amphidinium_carterae.1
MQVSWKTTMNRQCQSRFKKERDEISSISQTLNDVLVHSTKPGSEPHSMIRRIMRTTNGFETWRQLNLPYAGGHRNKFHDCAQSCLHSGMPTNISQNNTTDGWETSIRTNPKAKPSQTTSRLQQSSIT